MAFQKKTPTETTEVTFQLRPVTVAVEIKGTRPLLMHNGRLSDPLDPIVIMKKTVTDSAKGGKGGEEKERKIAALEFEGGLYLDERGLPCIPADNVDAMLAQAATEWKLGAAFGRLVRCTDDSIPLKYRGMEKIKKTADLMQNMKEFSLRKRVVNSGMSAGSSWRTRPRFNDWALSFKLSVLLGSKVELQHVRNALEAAGLMYGLADWEGRYGLFDVVKFVEQK